MELRSLRYFVYVAEARSFSRAAVHLHVAQPALSRQVRKLEDEIGARLFVRTGRHLELTEAGRVLLERAHALLQQASSTIEEVRGTGTGLRGTVGIGVSSAVCEVFTPILMRECARLHPGITVRFVEGFSGLIFDKLLNQEIALGLLHNPPAHRAIASHALLREAMYLVGPPRRGDLSQLTRRNTLASLPMILPSPTHALRLLLEQALARGGRALQVATQVDGLVTTRALVAAGFGYTILPYSSVHHQLASGQVGGVRLSGFDIDWVISVAHRVAPPLTPPVAAVLDIVRGQMLHLASDRTWGMRPR